MRRKTAPAFLKRLLESKKIIRVLEAHNGLTGLIAEKTSVTKNGVTREFDAVWESSLTDSTAKGKPDIEAVDTTSRLQTVNEIFEVTTKPMIYDGDTGGQPEHFAFTVRTLERTGVSAIVIEDKVGLKRNSLLGTDVEQHQATIEEFCHKLRTGKQAQVSNAFMIFARIESFIFGKPVGDALERALTRRCLFNKKMYFVKYISNVVLIIRGIFRNEKSLCCNEC